MYWLNYIYEVIKVRTCQCNDQAQLQYKTPQISSNILMLAWSDLSIKVPRVALQKFFYRLTANLVRKSARFEQT